jgi:hypothetical protein
METYNDSKYQETIVDHDGNQSVREREGAINRCKYDLTLETTKNGNTQSRRAQDQVTAVAKQKDTSAPATPPRK